VRIIELSNRYDAIVAYRYIGGIPWTACAIQNVTVPYNQVVFAGVLLGCLRTRSRRRVESPNSRQKYCDNNGPSLFHRFSVKAMLSSEATSYNYLALISLKGLAALLS
jgi:hypothetical protein